MSELDPYDYHLPAELIAQQPLTRRSDARLMVVRRDAGEIDHHHVRDLPQLLSAGDTLVLNNTRVVPARLVGRRTDTGGRWSGLFLKADEQGNWLLLAKTRGRVEPGETITLEDRHSQPALQLRLVARLEDGSWVMRPLVDGETYAMLDSVGRVPLPPYIRQGEMVDADWQSYQTVFAEEPGAVAAPTAGLHFTPQLFESLATAGVATERVTLHVGVGTFRPITADRLADHPMHYEQGSITHQVAERINHARTAGGRTIAIGTTSVRVLETAANEQGQLTAWTGQTNLFIRPPYQFKAVDALLTNFHLPRSTLLILIHTLAGPELMRRAYEEAIEEGYRFYSYGDAMLIL